MTISVIIPAYNAAAFVGEAIDSVLAQTLQPDQIIVVNDGSQDDTAKVLAGLRACGYPIAVIHKPNGGISSARNAGLAHATGDYIAMLDADDRWHPDYLSDQAAVLDAHPDVVCSFTNFNRFDDRTRHTLGEQFRYYDGLLQLPSAPGPIPHTHVLTGDAFSSLVAFSEIPCFMQVTMFRSSLLAGRRFNEYLYLGEDYDFALRSYLLGRVAYNTRP
jgi:glycosyltransferase involved in cell wall biosynthesis